MDFLTDSLGEALAMIWSLDRELYFIVYVSLYISFFSTLLSTIPGVRSKNAQTSG